MFPFNRYRWWSSVATVFLLILAGALPLRAQDTRAGAIEQQVADKVRQLEPYRPGKLERTMLYIEENNVLRRLSAKPEGWYPRLGGLTTGSGFAIGPGYRQYFGREGLFEISAAASLKTYRGVEMQLRSPLLASDRLALEARADYVPHFPNPALANTRPDDTFWAARRVMAFSDEMIRTVVQAGQYTDARATDYLTQVLIKRRNKIGQIWLTNVNPVVDVSLDPSGTLRFSNAAVTAGAADASREYQITFATFDNAAHTATPQGSAVTATTGSAAAPASLMSSRAEYVRAEISAIHDKFPAWKAPVRATFRREGNGWKTVGLDRMPAQQADPSTK